MKLLLVSGMLAATGLAGAADARPRPEQNSAYEDARAGRIKPLREIEGRVLPRMGGARYLGPELHEDRYRLKFMDRGSVIWVDVDPRTGAIIGRAD
ncbi:hypothetical protein ABC347_09830 [Sphingomonas sp. 1P06PA]|uniref:hypothetical protein n=1 Tax=Sphingomonas sp. 1P06PA TaxID=554121 RepID=UPI0039A5C552